MYGLHHPVTAPLNQFSHQEEGEKGEEEIEKDLSMEEEEENSKDKEKDQEKNQGKEKDSGRSRRIKRTKKEDEEEGKCEDIEDSLPGTEVHGYIKTILRLLFNKKKCWCVQRCCMSCCCCHLHLFIASLRFLLFLELSFSLVWCQFFCYMYLLPLIVLLCRCSFVGLLLVVDCPYLFFLLFLLLLLAFQSCSFSCREYL